MASFSCKRLLNPFTTERIVVASVGERKLFSSDIKDLFTKNMTPEDSIAIMESYANMWVKNQLKLERAELMFSDNQDDIDKMVREYRNSLLNYKLDQHYIEKVINDTITDSDIKKYYKLNSKEFRLDNVIVKGRVVKVPESYRQYEKLQELMNSSNAEKQQDFLDICNKNNFQLVTFDTWIYYDKFLVSLPTSEGDNYVQLQTKTGVQFMADESYKYLFNIYEKRLKGDISPIELTKDKIRKIILNQRRVDIIKSYENSLYTKAMKKRRISINIHRPTTKTTSTDSIIADRM